MTYPITVSDNSLGLYKFFDWMELVGFFYCKSKNNTTPYY